MILANIAKFIGAKVAAAIITVAVVAGGVWCYQNPEAVRTFGHVVKLTLLWLAIAAALPWTSYLYLRPLIRFQAERLSTYAASVLGAAVVVAYGLADIVLAFYLGDFTGAGTFTWIVLILGFLAAGAYNFVICESLARHIEA